MWQTRSLAKTLMRIALTGRAAFFSGFLVYISLLVTPSVSAERQLFGWDADPLTSTISADRPGFSTSPQTVPAGRLQIEGGYQFTADRGVDNHAMPLLLLRAGLTKKLELRISWDGLSWTENNGRFKSAASDMSLGLKAQLSEQTRLLPALGVLGVLSFPTGHGSSTSNRVDPTGGLLWNHDLAAGLGIFGTVLLSSVTGDDGRFFEAANAIGVSLPLNARFGSFVEYFGVYRKGGSGPAHNLNGGLTCLLNDNLQLDLNGGFGMNGRADDYFLGPGLAFRF
jgi:hypothetical protein